MAKFKIGQEVCFKNDLSKNTCILITEIQEITCSAGTQVFYSGRLWIQKEFSKQQRICTKELWKANEIELETIKKEKPKKKKG